MKSFIKGPVEKGEYGDSVSIKWSPGHDPELVLYDTADNEVRPATISRKLSQQPNISVHGTPRGC